MGHSIDQVANLAKDTAGFFTGGTSGVNVAQGKAPTKETLATDAAGLAAGAGLAGSGLLDAGATGLGSSGSSGLEAILNPQSSPVPGAGISLGTPAVGAGSAVDYASPAVQALMSGAGGAGESVATSGEATAPSGGGVGPSGAGVQAGGGPLQAGGGGVVSTGGASAPTAVTGAQAGAQGGDAIGGILKTMRENAGLIGLGLSGASLAMAGQQRPIPNQQQLNDLAQSGSQAAKDLIGSYRSGQVSAAQQASLDQLTQQTKNQINNYFSSIGQSDSTAHMQALAQVDQQALGMKQQMLDNMLQQGLSAIGVAQGPLGTIANYQVQQDKNLSNAFGNFANAVGQAFGRQSGQTQAENPNKNISGATPSSGVAMRGGTTGLPAPSGPGATPRQ